MAVASWMFRGRTIRSRRINRGRNENDEDYVQMDFTKDPSENMCEILSNLTAMNGVSEGRRLSYLNAFVRLVSRPDAADEEYGYTSEEILHCLRPLAFHDNAQLKNASFRAVRHFIKTEKHVDIYVSLKYDFLIARQITAAGIQLCRRVLVVAPEKFTYAPVQAMVSLAHPSHADNLQAAALAFLAEIAILNADVFITCGGVNAIIRYLPYIRSTRMAGALLGSLLYLMNRPETRTKAAINLHCLTDSVYMDRSLNYNKNSLGWNGPDGSARWCTSVLVSLLKSWTGVVHLCEGKRRAIASVVNSLYISHLQKPMLEALYELFQLTQPTWTDEMSVALDGVDPSRWQSCFRLSEGFLCAETNALFPHLAKCRVNLLEAHLTVVLATLLDANLLDAIVHVIVSDDTFLSVRATVLLGELLHLVHWTLPPEICSGGPGLPDLLSYAVRGRPVRSVGGTSGTSPPTVRPRRSPSVCEDDLDEDDPATAATADDPATVTTAATPPRLPGQGPPFVPRPSVHETQGESEGSAGAGQRALAAVAALSCLHKILRKSPVPSLYLAHLVGWAKGLPLSVAPLKLPVSTSCDEAIRESGVLVTKDPLAWKWDGVRAVLKNNGETLRKTTDSNRKMFVRRLVHFLLPSGSGFCRVEIGSNRKRTSRLTLAALDLLSVLLLAPEDSECHKLLSELLLGIRSSLEEVAGTKSAHDCLFSPQNVSNSLCQDYFLFLGHLTRTEPGRKALEKNGLYPPLMNLVVSTNHDCYVKIIVSTLDYSNDEMARKILSKALESKSISSRLYSTKMLHALVRVGIGHDKALTDFVIGLIVDQLGDEDPNVASVALNTLQEACDSKEYVEAVVEQRPCLLRLGDNGVLLLVRCLSAETGFKALQQGNFVTNQLQKWAQHFNYRYVGIVEGIVCDSVVDAKGETYLPPHLYQQLASHKPGLALLLADPHLADLSQILEAGECSTEKDILEVKSALYALSGVATYLDPSVLHSAIRIATSSPVYSLRATAFFALSNVATTRPGSRKLHKLGWYTVRHDRHNRWPLVAPLNTRDRVGLADEEILTASDNISEGCKSGLSHLPEETDADTEEFYWGIPGGKTCRVRERRSATLPHATGAQTYYHNRSYSESKAECSEASDYRYEFSGRKSRSNSYTDSSTSGDSSYGIRHLSMSERVQTLSPIPSAGSLTAPTSSRTRRASILSSFSRSSLRGSHQSVLKSLPAADEYPPGLITYGELHQLSPVARQRPPEIGFGSPESLASADFSTLDSNSDLESSPGRLLDRSTGSDTSSDLEDTTPCYMGITLPSSLNLLFPKEEKNLINQHVAFMSENLNVQGLEGLKNPSFHREICFLGTRGLHNTMISTSESEGQDIIEADHLLEKETLQDNSAESSITDVPNIVEQPMPIIFKNPLIIRSEVSRMVEQLSNPVLHKTCKQSLLQIKQAHGSLFQDVCVFSDVSYILSTCHVRVASRDLIHELFDSPFVQIWADARSYLEEANARRMQRIRLDAGDFEKSRGGEDGRTKIE